MSKGIEGYRVPEPEKGLKLQQILNSLEKSHQDRVEAVLAGVNNVSGVVLPTLLGTEVAGVKASTSNELTYLKQETVIA